MKTYRWMLLAWLTSPIWFTALLAGIQLLFPRAF